MQSTLKLTRQRLLALLGAAVVSTLIVLAILEIVSRIGWSIAQLLYPDPLRPEMSAAYAGATWVPDLVREQDLRKALPYTYVPFRLIGVPPWHGKYFNNDEHPTGVWRRTLNPSHSECQNRPTSQVWVFGGSTVYGTGVPDWATLPSYLSRRLNTDGRTCVMVTNFGNESYVTTQELILLMEQLRRGGKPDVVIFYDGFNDAHAGMAAADPWSAHFEFTTIKARAEGSFQGRMDFLHRLRSVRVIDSLRQLLTRRSESVSPRDLDAKATLVVDNYEANHCIAGALGKAYHFRFFGFWQPMLFYGRKPSDSFEQQIMRFDATNKSRFDATPVVAAYQEAEMRAPKSNFIYLAHLFDSVSEPIYIDEAHLGPQGNELAANAIAKYIQDHADGIDSHSTHTPRGALSQGDL